MYSMSDEEPTPIELFDLAIRRELDRHVKEAGGADAVATRLHWKVDKLRRRLRGETALRVVDADEILVYGCQLPWHSINDLMGRASQAAGRPVASIQWGGGIFFGPDHGLILPDDVKPIEPPDEDGEPGFHQGGDDAEG